MRTPLLANLKTMPDARTLLPSLPHPRTPDQRAYARTLLRAIIAQAVADPIGDDQAVERAVARAQALLERTE